MRESLLAQHPLKISGNKREGRARRTKSKSKTRNRFCKRLYGQVVRTNQVGAYKLNGVYSPTGIGRPDRLIWMISIKIMLGYAICLSLLMINFISYPLFKIQLIPSASKILVASVLIFSSCLFCFTLWTRAAATFTKYLSRGGQTVLQASEILRILSERNNWNYAPPRLHKKRHLRDFYANTRLYNRSLVSKLPNSSTSAVETNKITSLFTLWITGPFTSQLPLLIGIEVLIIVTFVLSILTLFANTSTGLLRQSAIVTDRSP
jgi:hypothetical protein